MSEIMHVPSSTLLHHAHIIYFQEKKQIMPMIQNNNNANLSAEPKNTQKIHRSIMFGC